MKLLDVSELADFWLQNLNWEYPNAENLNLYLKGTTDGIYRFQVLDSMCVQDYPVFKNVCIYTLTGDGVEHPYIAQDALSPDDTVIFDSMLLRTTNLYISCNAVINRNNRSGANYRNFLNTTLHVDGNLTVDSGRWHFNTVNVGGTLTLETYAENLGRGNIIKCRELSIRSSYYSQQILDNNLFIVGNRMIDTGHQSSSQTAGTFTPVLYNGTEDISSLFELMPARYIRTGNMIHITAYFRKAASGTTDYSFRFGNLPFTPDVDNEWLLMLSNASQPASPMMMAIAGNMAETAATVGFVQGETWCVSGDYYTTS